MCVRRRVQRDGWAATVSLRFRPLDDDESFRYGSLSLGCRGNRDEGPSGARQRVDLLLKLSWIQVLLDDLVFPSRSAGVRSVASAKQSKAGGNCNEGPM